jgi:hypothetical protein
MRMSRPHPDRFPPDPNAPAPPSKRVPGRPLALEAPAPAIRDAALLERELAQLSLIGPAAGAELRSIVYGDGERAAARRPTTARSPRAATRPRRR